MANQPLQLRLNKKRVAPTENTQFYINLTRKMRRKNFVKREFRILLTRATASYFFKGF